MTPANRDLLIIVVLNVFGIVVLSQMHGFWKGVGIGVIIVAVAVTARRIVAQQKRIDAAKNA